MSEWVTVVGAYGREYKTLKEMQKDWDENRDFYMSDLLRGSYINKSDAEKFGVRVNGRYGPNLIHVGTLH